MGAYRALIDCWLEGDRGAPRKQRHSAHRVWERLVEEHGARVAERTVRKYVHDRRRALGEVGEVFVLQHHAPGAEAEVDWGEAVAMIAGQRVRVHLFHLRLSHSGAAFAAVFGHETQQAFLEADVDAFAFLGGVPAVVGYEYVARHIFEILCPTGLCGRQQDVAGDHGDRRRGVMAAGHITLARPARVLPLSINREEVVHVGDVFR
jgi:transposase